MKYSSSHFRGSCPLTSSISLIFGLAKMKYCISKLSILLLINSPHSSRRFCFFVMIWQKIMLRLPFQIYMYYFYFISFNI